MRRRPTPSRSASSCCPSGCGGPPHASVSGKVVRLNHARHGAPNGVLLDSGDFVHTRPDGFETLGLKVGDMLEAEGPARPLATGTGRVIEAHRANGHALAPRR